MNWDWGMDTFRRRIENLERSLWSDFGGGQLSTTQQQFPQFSNMKVDLKEVNDKFELMAELPGLEKKDIKIDLDEDTRMLSIKGEKKFEREEKRDEGKYFFKERSFGSFDRSFRLPDNVDMNRLKATMNNGLLCIDIPKTPQKEKSKMRSIQIGDQGRSNA